MVPVKFKKYFWDTEFNKLDIKKNMKYIISRLFCEGDLDAIQWLKKMYTQEEILETAKTSRRLNPITASFLKNVYNLKENDMQYYINIKNMNYQYMGWSICFGTL